MSPPRRHMNMVERAMKSFARPPALALDLCARYGDYEKRAGDRTIPLIRLQRATG